jgi:branched-chain amino acid transport system substrate-binding protein
MRLIFNRTFLLCCLSLGLMLQSCDKENEDDDSIPTETVNVGALLSLTGNWSSLGVASKAAIQLALEDINSYQKANYARHRFTATFFDTKLDAALAQKYIADGSDKSRRFFIGPQSSAEVAAVKSYADANNIMVVSQGSTAGVLSIANDNVFRFCPDDRMEGAAIAQTIAEQGVKGLITIAREDPGNKGLQTATSNAFAAGGGMVSSLDPYATTTTDFTDILNDIRSRVITMSVSVGGDKVGVYFACFDEGVALMHQAAGDPLLTSVKWYGADGVVLSSALVADSAASDFAIATHFFAPTYGLPLESKSKWEPLAMRIKAITGADPDAFALATYDAMWVIAMSYNVNPNVPFGFNRMKATFQDQANKFFGATGPTQLNEAGDRALGSFDYFGIDMKGGSFNWVLVGKSK